MVAAVPEVDAMRATRPSPALATSPVNVTVAALEEDSVKELAPNAFVVKSALNTGVPEELPRSEL